MGRPKMTDKEKLELLDWAKKNCYWIEYSGPKYPEWKVMISFTNKRKIEVKLSSKKEDLFEAIVEVQRAFYELNI